MRRPVSDWMQLAREANGLHRRCCQPRRLADGFCSYAERTTLYSAAIWSASLVASSIMRAPRSRICLPRSTGCRSRCTTRPSKATVIGLTHGLACELGRDNIPVNAVTPTAVMTEATAEFFGDRIDRRLEVIHAGQSIQRTLAPADLAGTIAWLIGDGSQFVTGQTIAVDGGTVML